MENSGLAPLFSREFPPEITSLIVAQMDHPTLKQYSLANRTANDDTNRILWEVFRICCDDEQVKINPRCNALIDNPHRARHVRALIMSPLYASNINKRVPEPVFTAEDLTKLANALNLLRGLRALYIHSGFSWWPLWNKMIAELLGSNKWEFHITTLATAIPLDHHFIHFCNGQRELRSLYTDSSSPMIQNNSPLPDPDALPCLREVSGDPALVLAFVPHRPVTEVQVECSPPFLNIEVLVQALSMSSEGIRTLRLSLINSEDGQVSFPSILRPFKALPIVSLHLTYVKWKVDPRDDIDVAAVVDEFPALRELSFKLIREQPAPSLEEVTRYWGRRSSSLCFLTFEVYPATSMTGSKMYSSFSRSVGGSWQENLDLRS